jgi:hypothetical protein
MWSVVKENAHLVHLKEVTDLGTNYKWKKNWVLNKRRNGIRTSVYIWCRGKWMCLEWKLVLLKCKINEKCIVVLHNIRNVDVSLQLGHPLPLQTLDLTMISINSYWVGKIHQHQICIGLPRWWSL